MSIRREKRDRPLEPDDLETHESFRTSKSKGWLESVVRKSFYRLIELDYYKECLDDLIRQVEISHARIQKVKMDFQESDEGEWSSQKGKRIFFGPVVSKEGERFERVMAKVMREQESLWLFMGEAGLRFPGESFNARLAEVMDQVRVAVRNNFDKLEPDRSRLSREIISTKKLLRGCKTMVLPGNRSDFRGTGLLMPYGKMLDLLDRDDTDREHD